jgi:hypothetical protein
MFVGDEVLLDVSFDEARARLTALARGGSLRRASEDAYRRGIAGLPGAAAQRSPGLAQVSVREVAGSDDAAGLAVRWEAAGADGGLFPVLDADLKLSPMAAQVTVLALAGAYRPLPAPGGAPPRDAVRRAGAATARNFLGRVAAGITGQPGPAPLPYPPGSTAPSAPDFS